MSILDPPGITKSTLVTSTRQALAASVLARMSRSDSEKISLYTGPAPVWSVNAASQITSGVIRTPRRTVPAYGNLANSSAVDVDNDPNFRYLNTPYMSYGTSSPDNRAVRAPLLIGGASQSAYWFPRISFYYDGQTFEFYGKAIATATVLRMRINGKLVTLDMADIGVTGLTAGSFYYWKCDLGSQAMRLIEIDINTSVSFGGIMAEPTAGISRGAAPTLRLAALTDSIGAGSNLYSRVSSWTGVMTELFGNDVAMYNAGIGGTGYTVTAGTSDFITRVPDIVATKPDILFIEGEQNDGSATASQLQATATSLFTTINTQLPNTLVFVIGAYSSYTPSASKMQHDAALRAAAAATNNYFISLLDPTNATVSGSGIPTWAASTVYALGDEVVNPSGTPQTCIVAHTSSSSFDQTKWKATAIIFGTGKGNSLTGDGNADVMIHSDGIHPTQRGCMLLGNKIYQATKLHLRTIANTGITGAVY